MIIKSMTDLTKGNTLNQKAILLKNCNICEAALQKMMIFRQFIAPSVHKLAIVLIPKYGKKFMLRLKQNRLKKMLKKL